MGQKEIMMTLDLSTTCSGLAVWENKKYRESYVIDERKIKDIDERTVSMGKKLISALNYFNPTLVYTEDSYNGKNPKTMKCLCRIHGIVMGWCIAKDVEYHFIMPSSWRQYIKDCPNGRGSNRDEQKLFAINYVKNNYHIQPKTDDEAEAICIGEAVIKFRK